MHKIEYLTAKNNSLSCKIDNILLHSAYNPENEAKNVVETIHLSFKPDYFFIIEPGINYLYKLIKQKFPDCKICILRFTKDFDDYNYNADKNFYILDTSANSFETDLINFFHDEGILKTHFIQWQPSGKIFKQETDFAWETIKKVIQYSQTILNTNGFFAKRWLKNSISFLKFSKNFSTIKKGHCDILVTASGISLNSSLNDIKKIRKEIFLIAVSSSLKPLIYAGILPDMVISTDGGFWAKKHLSPVLLNKALPVALSPESNCPKKILQENPIISLCYSDGIGSTLVKKLIPETIFAERNGTVSGTAIEFALSITDGNVYVCGLDLSGSPSFQHTNPNEIETFNSCFDNKINNVETRQTISRFNLNSLKVYETWFSKNSRKFNNRVIRISNGFNYQNKLGEIKDIDFSKIKIKTNSLKPEITKPFMLKINIQQIKEEITKFSENDDFIKECFPIECLTASRTVDSVERENLNIKLKTDTKRLIESLF